MPENFIDIRTLAFALMLVTGLMASVMFFVLRAQKTYPGTGFWVLSNFAGTVGFLCLGLRGYAPDLITIFVGNMLAVGTTAFALEGNRRFLELERKSSIQIWIMAVYGLTVIYQTYVSPSVTMRIITASIVSAVLTYLSYRAFTEKPGLMTNVVYRTVAMTFLLFSIFMLLRMFASMTFESFSELYTPEWIQTVSFMIFLVFATVWTLNYVVLNSERLNEELRSKEAELHERATTDFLTGLSNKRAFDEFANSEIKRSRRYNIPTCLVLIDLDHFKNVNDTFGHAVGDKVLVEIGQLLKRMTRQHDLIARIGGEEFGLLLTHTDVEGGHAVAEAFRREIQDLEIKHGAIDLSITSSFGLSELREADSLETLMERSDANLYKAKKKGRNRVISDSKSGLRLLSQA